MDYDELLDNYINKDAAPEPPEPASSNDDTEYDRLVQEYFEKTQEVKEQIPKAALKGATFGVSKIAEAAYRSSETDEPLDLSLIKIGQQEDAARSKYPLTMFAAEMAGAIPTGFAVSKSLTNVGVKSLTAQGAIEGGAYGTLTEGPEAGLIGTAGGAVVGRMFDSLGNRVVGDAVEDSTTPLADDVKRKVASGDDLSGVSDDELWESIYEYGKRETIEANRPLMDEAESIAAKIDKDMEKSGVTEETRVRGVTPVTLTKAQKYFTDGISDPKAAGDIAKRIADVVGKRGGLRFTDDVAELAEADKIFTGSTGSRSSVGPARKWFSRNFLPVSDLLSDYLDPRIGNAFSRAAGKAITKNAQFTDKVLKPAKDVIKYIDSNEEAFKRLMDLNRKPEYLDEVRSMVRKDLGEGGLKQFDDLWQYGEEINKLSRGRLFKREDDVDWDVNYIHTQKRKDMEGNVRLDEPIGSPYQEGIDAAKTRSRKSAFDMKSEELAEYMNPLLSHAKYITDMETLLQLQKGFGLRPSMSMKGTTGDLFGEVRKRFIRDGFSDADATTASNLMHEAFMGSRKAPPPYVRAFMNLSYAGTLAQFKTAVLNVHDVAVAAVNNGSVPTMKAVTSSMGEEFGRTVRSFLGEQNFGEFVRDYDKFTSSPSAWSRLSRGSKVVSDGSMFISGFRYFDELGKGVVLRSAVENARLSASRGTLYDDFGSIFRPYELAQIEPWLKKGVAAKDMPQRARELVEELALTKLAEQQLISFAGRPVGYLSNPILRPAYAMTGFAIKQMALLRANVYNNLKKGNYAAAGQYAAKYVVYAGMGYGMINELRSAVFKKEPFEPEDVLLGTLDQIAAAMTLNRLGDEYSRQMFWNNPVDFLMTSFLPPGGMGEALGQAVVGDMEPVLERLPAGGDIYKYYIKDED